MSDTQWPRYEVFKQDTSHKPHESVGSVHAVDGEMALQNGRDIYVRRPRCHSLWVVRSDAIFAKTAEELENDDSWRENITPATANETYLVFQKQTERRGMIFVTHVGSVDACSPQHALQLALHQFENEHVFVWWVCPETAVTQSTPRDIDPMFTPAQEKKYRMPNQYKTVFSMQKIKREKE